MYVCAVYLTIWLLIKRNLWRSVMGNRHGNRTCLMSVELPPVSILVLLAVLQSQFRTQPNFLYTYLHVYTNGSSRSMRLIQLERTGVMAHRSGWAVKDWGVYPLWAPQSTDVHSLLADDPANNLEQPTRSTSSLVLSFGRLGPSQLPCKQTLHSPASCLGDSVASCRELASLQSSTGWLLAWCYCCCCLGRQCKKTRCVCPELCSWRFGVVIIMPNDCKQWVLKTDSRGFGLRSSFIKSLSVGPIIRTALRVGGLSHAVLRTPSLEGDLCKYWQHMNERMN